MNCPSCGHNCPTAATFYEACGTRLRTDQAGAGGVGQAPRQTVCPSVSEEMKSLAHYQQSLSDMSRSVRPAKQGALDLEDAHAYYYKRVMRNCLVAGIILFAATCIGLATTSDVMPTGVFTSDDLPKKVGTALAFGLLSIPAFF